MRAALDHAQLGDRDLEIGEDLEEHRLELLVGLVDLVDQEDDGLGVGDRAQERAREEEVLGEDLGLRNAACRTRCVRCRRRSRISIALFA